MVWHLGRVIYWHSPCWECLAGILLMRSLTFTSIETISGLESDNMANLTTWYSFEVMPPQGFPVARFV